MNAVTQTEARAIENAAPLEMADPSKNLILVALSQLLPRRSKRNARKMPRLSIPELAASIARIGPAAKPDRDRIRRWRALRGGGR
ncbi:putative chromosome segregation protein [Pseudomonas aeruginosa]|nr:putative chromosome segregation protein [Pseudomonas aeruginosa]